jgi:hypothetical protein
MLTKVWKNTSENTSLNNYNRTKSDIFFLNYGNVLDLACWEVVIKFRYDPFEIEQEIFDWQIVIKRS